MAPEQKPPQNQSNPIEQQFPEDEQPEVDARLWQDASGDRILYGLFKSNEENENARVNGLEHSIRHDPEGFAFTETRELLSQAIARRREELAQKKEEP